MTKISQLETKMRKLAHPYLTDNELAMMLDGTADSRYGIVKRLMAQGKLLSVRRGLYALGEVLGYDRVLHPFELAQYVYGPSYISLESALSYHELIPEKVYTFTSVVAGRSKVFHTGLGVFSYSHVPALGLYTEVERVDQGNYQFFVAKPWRAICDYAYCYKKEWKSAGAMFEDLRINEGELPVLRNEVVSMLCDYYKSRRMNRFLKKMHSELWGE